MQTYHKLAVENIIQLRPEKGIHWAAIEGYTLLVKLLLDRGVDVNEKSVTEKRTALHLAVIHRRESTVRILLDRGAMVNVLDKVFPGLEYLVETPGTTPLHYVAGATPLHYAAGAGLESTVLMLLDAGAEVDALDIASGRTALHVAVLLGRESIVRLLLDAGAGIDAPQDINGMTALHMAAYMGHERILHLLLQRGANVEIRGDIRRIWGGPLWSTCKVIYRFRGLTALHHATMRRRDSCVRTLLDWGAEIDAQDTGGGRTALHMAAMFGTGAVGERGGSRCSR